jgi:hypothetical protein
MWIVRWPIVLALFAYVIVCIGLAAGTTVERLGLVAADNAAWRTFAAHAANATWVQTALFAAAAAFLFVAAVRLARRTQAFWVWLIGFGLFGARWGLMQQAEGGLNLDVAQISSDISAPGGAQRLASNVAYDFGLVGVLLVLGLIILILDAVDRAHWARRTE